MCGIAGYIDLSASTSEEVLHQQAQAMAKAMVHRGPDDHGVWTDVKAGLALAQSRLAIIDLSSAGHQPMASASGRYVIVYNGEIYNTEDLRRDLDGINWAGHSDTEVIVEGCARWGVKATVEKLIGMFAFALWDREDRTLTLVRDRFGIKPLYWGDVDGKLLFGSELKALKAVEGWTQDVDRNALASYLRFNYVPAPHSIFKGVHKLQPGHILTWDNGKTEIESYWSLREVAAKGLANPFEISDEEAITQLDELVCDAVARRMVADVPVGAFLSGGIDSSTVVAAMVAKNSGPVHTFSIGMDVKGYNEAVHAKAIAKHLGTEHTELYVTPDDARAVIPDLPTYYDEPFSDSSQIPTFLVSQMARKSVTVALSGDGGDELFCGYNRYFWGDQLWRKTGALPGFVKHGLAGAIRALSPDQWDALGKIIPAKLRPQLLGIKAHKAADVLSLNDQAELFRRLVTVWENPADVVPGSTEPHDILWDQTLVQDIKPFQERMQVLDGLTYLPDDILTKVDRASMAVSLEARVPLLDHRIAEFAYQLPRNMRVRDGQGKWILREVLARHVPRELFERPKMGFGIPIGKWLSGPLRDWVEDLLDPVSLEQDGLLNAAPIRAAWDAHLSGRTNNEVQLWTILMFQAWRKQAQKEGS
ncbi:MAG: asparagine synthase (glutamine-hydrolyzing) [Rhodospirillaceae bacterium]|nr:MAG: asparagine synthase (glutamine-hydrolyzing) [Rhodospirillaceae bacterium]